MTRFASLLLLAIATPCAAQTAHPVKIPAAQAEAALAGPTASARSRNGVDTKNVTMLASTDKKMSAGVYSATASRNEIASYGEDEFMYFLKGGVTLTSADGTVTEVKAGDAVTIPKGWKGVWDTKGYTKYYVVYNADKAS